jgi:hypothetical protein
MDTLDSAALAQLQDLDALDPADALALLARVRAWSNDAASLQMARARVCGLSWRSIAAASGVPGSTVRRWALSGAPTYPRRRWAS